MGDDIKRMDIAEFRAAGFLQELNRCFLHPLGLALEVVVQEDGAEALGGVWDYRHDPEGMVFADLDAEAVRRAETVAAERERHVVARSAMFGDPVQPLP